jgi:hypothetical protein
MSDVVVVVAGRAAEEGGGRWGQEEEEGKVESEGRVTTDYVELPSGTGAQG